MLHIQRLRACEGRGTRISWTGRRVVQYVVVNTVLETVRQNTMGHATCARIKQKSAVLREQGKFLLVLQLDSQKRNLTSFALIIQVGSEKDLNERKENLSMKLVRKEQIDLSRKSPYVFECPRNIFCFEKIKESRSEFKGRDYRTDYYLRRIHQAVAIFNNVKLCNRFRKSVLEASSDELLQVIWRSEPLQGFESQSTEQNIGRRLQELYFECVGTNLTCSEESDQKMISDFPEILESSCVTRTIFGPSREERRCWNVVGYLFAINETGEQTNRLTVTLQKIERHYAYYHLIVISTAAVRSGQRGRTAFTVPWKSSSLTSGAHSDRDTKIRKVYRILKMGCFTDKRLVFANLAEYEFKFGNAREKGHPSYSNAGAFKMLEAGNNVTIGINNPEFGPSSPFLHASQIRQQSFDDSIIFWVAINFDCVYSGEGLDGALEFPEDVTQSIERKCKMEVEKFEAHGTITVELFVEYFDKLAGRPWHGNLDIIDGRGIVDSKENFRTEYIGRRSISLLRNIDKDPERKNSDVSLANSPGSHSFAAPPSLSPHTVENTALCSDIRTNRSDAGEYDEGFASSTVGRNPGFGSDEFSHSGCFSILTQPKTYSSIAAIEYQYIALSDLANVALTNKAERRTMDGSKVDVRRLSEKPAWRAREQREKEKKTRRRRKKEKEEEEEEEEGGGGEEEEEGEEDGASEFIPFNENANSCGNKLMTKRYKFLRLLVLVNESSNTFTNSFRDCKPPYILKNLKKSISNIKLELEFNSRSIKINTSKYLKIATKLRNYEIPDFRRYKCFTNYRSAAAGKETNARETECEKNVNLYPSEIRVIERPDDSVPHNATPTRGLSHAPSGITEMYAIDGLITKFLIPLGRLPRKFPEGKSFLFENDSSSMTGRYAPVRSMEINEWQDIPKAETASWRAHENVQKHLKYSELMAFTQLRKLKYRIKGKSDAEICQNESTKDGEIIITVICWRNLKG
ncbi:hypothetical protein WN51_04313 [Melipona quadrifasciata]|uniref:Uncharacterized protein n=1 Tax=Melipona quadrifasciata TaxID=166423 RepID=A0A0M8ZR65_9HYME|nr:hypothetical protein WN51_04313 [Melipona quadrifasciata]